MIVLIDNRDSFVFNLARYIEELGFSTVVVRSDRISLKEIKALNPSHLIVSPGPCGPAQAGISMPAIEALYKHIPILGVCLGHQAIAQVFGAKVTTAHKAVHGKQDIVSHNQKGIFANLPTPFKAARYHSLVVASTLSDQLEKIADNEKGIVMGIKLKGYPTYGVQFHPESVLTEHGHQLLRNFLTLSC